MKTKIESKVKECPICKVAITEYRSFENKMFEISVPFWPCDCIEKSKNITMEKTVSARKEDLYRKSNIDAEFIENNFPVYREEIIPFYNSVGWITRGEQLLVFGDPGNHKTGHVTAIMKKAMDNLLVCKYYRATEMPYQRNLDELENIDLLVLDNFGKESFENSRGALFDLLDKRIHGYKSNILIVNSDLDRVLKIYDAPMVSRLNGFIKVNMDGQDKREKIVYGRPDDKF